MGRPRISTWVLAAVFLAALVAYILVKPSSASIIGPSPHHASHARTTPTPGLPLPGAGSTGSPRPTTPSSSH
jgi:hypothetical protein